MSKAIVPYQKKRTLARTGAPVRKYRKTTLTKRVKNLEKAVELKNYDTYVEQHNLLKDTDNTTMVGFKNASFATVNALNGPNNGTDDNDRIGRSICCKSLFLRGYISTNANPLAYVLRLTVAVDTMNRNSTAPNVGPWRDIAGYGGSLCSLAPRDLDKTSRFKILWDVTTPFVPQAHVAYNGTTTITSGTPALWYFEKYIDLKEMPVKFDGTGEGSSAIADNAIYIFATYCDSLDSSAATGSCKMTCWARVRFCDQ